MRKQNQGQHQGQGQQQEQQAHASAILLNAADNVICMLRDHKAGERPLLASSEQNTLYKGPTLTSDVPLGHKVAVADIPAATAVIKYGVPIGQSLNDIVVGEHVHLHNLAGFANNSSAP